MNELSFNKIEKLRTNTLRIHNIQKTKDGEYRFINDEDKLATVGYESKEVLFRFMNDLRFDSYTIAKMNKRYLELKNN